MIVASGLLLHALLAPAGVQDPAVPADLPVPALRVEPGEGEVGENLSVVLSVEGEQSADCQLIEVPEVEGARLALLAGPLGTWLTGQQGLRDATKAKVKSRRQWAIGAALVVAVFILVLTRDPEPTLWLGFFIGAGGFCGEQTFITTETRRTPRIFPLCVLCVSVVNRPPLQCPLPGNSRL